MKGDLLLALGLNISETKGEYKFLLQNTDGVGTLKAFQREEALGFVLVGLTAFEGRILGVIGCRIFFRAFIIQMALMNNTSGFLPPPLYLSMCWMMG